MFVILFCPLIPVHVLSQEALLASEPARQETNVDTIRRFTIAIVGAEKCSHAQKKKICRHGSLYSRTDIYPIVFAHISRDSMSSSQPEQTIKKNKSNVVRYHSYASFPKPFFVSLPIRSIWRKSEMMRAAVDSEKNREATQGKQ